MFSCLTLNCSCLLLPNKIQHRPIFPNAYLADIQPKLPFQDCMKFVLEPQNKKLHISLTKVRLITVPHLHINTKWKLNINHTLVIGDIA